ncbi:MAG: ATP-binding protein, partial [Porticoccaceae bacterium]|nr:ATP-binding protein [Porticoccaceae bacterium]
DLEQVTVPSLLIQPLVENAIKHGIEPSISGGSVRISLDAEDDNIVVKVVDTGVGIDPNRQPETSSGAGVGIANIRQRLASIYGGRGGLDIRENRDSGVTAILTIPKEEQP